MVEYDPSRLCHQVFLFKDRDYLLGLERQYGQQCHGINFHVWRWERQIYLWHEQHESDWKEMAIDRKEWHDSVLEKSRWNTYNYKG